MRSAKALTVVDKLYRFHQGSSISVSMFSAGSLACTCTKKIGGYHDIPVRFGKVIKNNDRYLGTLPIKFLRRPPASSLSPTEIIFGKVVTVISSQCWWHSRPQRGTLRIWFAGELIILRFGKRRPWAQAACQELGVPSRGKSALHFLNNADRSVCVCICTQVADCTPSEPQSRNGTCDSPSPGRIRNGCLACRHRIGSSQMGLLSTRKKGEAAERGQIMTPRFLQSRPLPLR